MSHKHRKAPRSAANYEKSQRIVRRMTLGQVLAHRDRLFAPLKDQRFETITQPLYTSENT